MSAERVAVIGLGLIGGSCAAALRSAGWLAAGWDIDPDHREIALARGLVDRIGATLSEAVQGADAVVVATPVSSMPEVLIAVDRVAPPSTLLLDTGSVKAPIVRVMATLSAAERAVGGHPLAGTEEAGPEAANPGLFHGRPFALSASSRTSPDALRRADALVRHLGARPVVVSADEHDRTIARTSHLPQLLATVLACTTESGDGALAGPGLADMTRLASSSANLWTDILLANRREVASATQGFVRDLEMFISHIERGDAGGIETLMDRGAVAAERLRGEGVGQ